MDQQKHWNQIGESYEGEIFDVFQSDKNKRLSHYFDKNANPLGTAIDFGCGTGKAFPFLSPRFKQVEAVDISKELLKLARKSPYKNISYRQADLSRKVKFGPADFIFCCNVIMLPEVEKNYRMIENICQCLKRTGHAVLVLPSMESMMFSSWRLIDWYRREGTVASKVPEDELSYFKGNKRDQLQGIVYIDNVPTKHYSAPELQVIFDDAGLEITALERLEYQWNTEFSSPPSWMKAPFPWDWLIECRKK